MPLKEISNGYSADDKLTWEGHIFSKKKKKYAILGKKITFVF